MPVVDKVFIKFDADGKPVVRELTRMEKAMARVNDRTEQMRATSGKIKKDFAAGFAAAAVAVTGFAIVMGKTVKAASNLEEQTAKFNKVFENTTVDVAKAVEDLKDKYALSTRAARQYLAATQDLLKPMGVLPDLAAKMSINVVKLAADLGSFNNLPTETVMRDIQSALVGNFETMKKYGVVLNEAAIKQEALNKKLWTGKGAISATAKAQAAWNLIQRGSVDAQGDMLRTSGSFANQMKFLKARFEDVSAEIGKVFLPAITAIVRAISAVLKALNYLPGPLKEIIIIMGTLTAGFIILKKVMLALGVTMKIAFAKVLLIIAALAAVAVIIKNWEKVKQFFKAFWNWLVSIAAKTWNEMKRDFFGFLKLTAQGVNEFWNLFAGVFNSMRDAIIKTRVEMLRAAGKHVEANKLMADSMRKPLINLDKINAAIDKSQKNIEKYGKQAKANWDKVKGVFKDVAKSVSLSTKNVVKSMNTVSKAATKAAENFNKSFNKMLESLKTNTEQMNDIVSAFNLARMGTAILGGEQQIELQRQLNELDIEMLTKHLGTKQALEVANMTQRLIQARRFADAEKLVNAAKNKAMEKQERQRFSTVIKTTTSFFDTISSLAKLAGNKNFKTVQAISYASAIVSGIEAAVHAWNAGMSTGGPWAPAVAAAYTAASIAKTAVQIAAIKGASPPAMAEGGVIKPSAQGSLIRAGEGGRSEAVIPFENPEAMDRLAQAGAGVGGTNIVLNFEGANLFGEDIPEKAMEAIDKGLYRLRLNSNSVALG